MASVMSKLRGNPTDDDLAELLPVGYKDTASTNWVPPDVRRDVANFDPRETEQIRRELIRRGSGDVVRDVRDGNRVHRHVADPADDDRSLDIVTLWETIRRCEMRQRDTARDARSAEHYAREFTCQSCGSVGGSMSAMSADGVRQRSYADGVVRKVCGRCDPLVEAEVLQRLAGETIADGRTRAAAVRAMLAVK